MTRTIARHTIFALNFRRLALPVVLFAALLPLWATSPKARASTEPVAFELRLDQGLVHYATTAQIDPTGIRREDAVIRATRRGDQWHNPRLRSTNHQLDRRLAVYDMDMNGLSWDGENLRGLIKANIGRIDFERDYGEGENMHSALKARRRIVVGWHIGGIDRIYPSPHRLEINARRLPDSHILDLTLDGLAGDNPDQARPMRITMKYRKGQWTFAEGLSPNWNRAVHSVDASELSIRDGRITGSMNIRINPDPWVPRSGPDGTRFRHWTVELDLRPTQGRISGRYQASQGETKRSGDIRGTMWDYLHGTYVIEGIDGRLGGAIVGRARPADASADEEQVEVRDDDGQPVAANDSPQTRRWSDLAHRLDVKTALHPDLHGYYTGRARHHDDVNPPMLFDIAENTNIAWRIPLRGTPAPPVVIDDRIYCVIPPDVVVCIDARTGRELWRKSINVIEDLAPEVDGQPGAMEDLRQAAEQQQELTTELHQTRGQLRRERRTLDDDQRSELEYRIESLEGEINSIVDQWRDAREHLSSIGITDYRTLDQRAGAPVVTDGSRIWVVFGTGVAACFDLDGNRLWQTRTGLSWTGGAEHAPVLAGDQLVLMGTVESPDDPRSRPYVVLSLDAGSGQERWRTRRLGTPAGLATLYIPARDGHAQRFVHVTADGTLIDAQDGRVIARSLMDISSPIPPLAYGDRAYLVGIRHGQMAIRVSLDDDGNIRHEQLWRIRRAGTSSHQITAPGLIHDDLLYLPRSTDESGGHHPIPWCQLDNYELAFGQHVARPNAIVVDTFTPLPLVRAGDVLVFSDRGQRGQTNPPFPMISFVTPGQRPSLLAQVRLPSGHLFTAPVFHGNRMIIRLNNELICIGSDDPEIAQRQAAAVARELIASIGHRPRIEAEEIYPAAKEVDSDVWPVSTLESNIPPDHWLMLGPFTGRDQAISLDAAALSSRLDKEVSIGGKNMTWRQLPRDVGVIRGAAMVYRSEGTFYRTSQGLDVGNAIDRQEYSKVYFLSVLHVPQTAAYSLRNQLGEVYISGQRVETTRPVQLEAGYHPMVLKVEITRIPPVGRIMAAPLLLQVMPPQQAIANWRNEVKRHESRLREIMQGGAGRDMALRARRLLEALED
ncbi:MAG: PQQ-binding-like beta-propeller repeat protein [Phycisphaeraceae bacterium]|nr:PQQ-binding-like beta-propeller repeat protein [Phycisphaeraceae bacterium]